MNVKSKIYTLFKEQKELSINEILDEISVSRQFVHRVLNQLLEANIIEKFGKSPKTVYKIIETALTPKANYEEIESSKIEFLNQNFLLITEVGKMLTGLEAFENWCIKRKLPLKKTIDEYIDTKNRYNVYFDKNKLVSGIDKLKNTKGYDKINLEELYYLDFYAIERFGKTRLGTILHYAKQGQNKMLMRILIDEIKKPINRLLETLKIDAIAYVPPTIKRETQLMKVLMNGLKINKPLIGIIKIGGIIPVPQKSLNKLEERISNAENTFVVRGNVTYKNVLLIDDAVGSGSTLNQISGKLKNKKIAKNVIGLAIVGSFKGFDVITDV
ncbi:HTH domain-containing protein [Flavobacterium sp.]|uniref:HTH domain-containing protein n=1 Tax=Flavobacterium sp. TaxID=239 RepID=UPI0025D78291|nr:HTH domain-containing protein [Flavobacterium sp.]